jgi:hypothetical protein
MVTSTNNFYSHLLAAIAPEHHTDTLQAYLSRAFGSLE